MTSTTKWLVCSGAGQFLEIAPKLVGAGFLGGVEWEPNVARALVRLSEVPKDAMGVVVAPGCLGGDPRETISLMVDFVGAAVTVLVDPAPDEPDVAHALDGVDIVIAPAGLFDVLLSLGRRLCADVGALERSPSGLACPPSEPAGAVTVPGALRAAQREETPQVTPGQPRGLRATGSFPRTTPHVSVPGKAEGAHAGDACAPWGAPPGAAGLDDLSSAPVETGACGAGAPACGGAATAPQATRGAPAPMTAPVADRPQVRLLETRMTEHVPTVCVASARGGVGKSAISALMAVDLARRGLRVALLDMDFQFGACLGFLGADETDGLTEAVGMGEQVALDERALARCRTSVEDGLEAFEFCRLPERSELLVPHAGALVRAARAGADLAIVDLPTGMSEGVAQVLEESDRCLLVCDQGALSLESLGALTALCGRAGTPLTKLVSVVNRCDQRHRDETFLSRARFELQTPQVVHVTDGGTEVVSLLSCGSAGELVSSRNRMALSVAQMASSLCADLGCAPSARDAAGRATPGRRQARAGAKRQLRGDVVPCPS